MEIRLEVSPKNPLVSENFTITVLVDHPYPYEVSIRPPNFPSEMILERIRSEGRNIQNPYSDGTGESENRAASSRWTAVEFLFNPLSAIDVELEPFEITVHGKKTPSEPVLLNIAAGTRTVSSYNPVFRWENPPASLASGEEKTLVLALSNWDPQQKPPQKFFGGRVPKNAIFEELPSGGPGTDRIIRYRYRLIPLPAAGLSGSSAGPSLEVGPFSFTFEGYALQVPGLVIRLNGTLPSHNPLVLQTPVSSDIPSFKEEDASEPIEDRALWSDFAQNDNEIPRFLRKEYERVGEAVKGLWEEGLYAGAIAELRRNERDSFAGPYFVPLRHKIEKELGFSSTEDETWQLPKKAALFLGFALILIVFLVVFLKISVTFSPKKGYKGVVISLSAVILVVALFCGGIVMESLNIKRLGSGGKAVLKRTPAYRIPDTHGTLSSHFDEGEPVNIRYLRGDWIYVESTANLLIEKTDGKKNGKTGWIPRDSAIIY
ncbi:MAG: hypothetical protein LBH43_08260 [Treponema sp.]|jgi:hypothetical protein|nr:hypothetical protein [Treponema sp.]